MSDLDVVWRGLMPYEEAWAEQRRLHEARIHDDVPDTVLLLEHPSVYTAGKRTEPWERPMNGTQVIDVDRGGRITWHGPGQLVGYPIIRLPEPLDVVAYVRRLEAFLIQCCAQFGVVTEAGSGPGRSGVWVSDDGLPQPMKKIASIGIRVSKRVTMHGFALNCNPDLSAFQQIVACGIADASATSLSSELGRDVSVSDVRPIVEQEILNLTAETAQT